MKILYISSHYNPFEHNTGSDQRYNLLLRVCANIADVDVVTFKAGVVSDIPNCHVIYSEESPLPIVGGRWYRLKRLLRPWNPYSFFHKDRKRSEVVENIVENGNYDYIVTRYIPRALECGLLKYADRLVIDVDDHPVDVMMTLSKDATSKRASRYYRLLSHMVKWSINRMLDKVCFSFFPNATQVHSKSSAYLPNIPYYETETLSYMDVPTHNLLFVGDLRYQPNIIGVEHFVEKILPIVQTEVPNVKLIIGGRYKDEAWKEKMMNHSGVQVLGFVDDLQNIYQVAQVCVVPVYSGAGTNIKVLEALQMGRACIVSHEATRGFSGHLKDGESYCVAKNDEEFADQIINLLQDLNKCKLLASKGSNVIADYYSRNSFYDIVKKSLTHE